MSCGYDKGLLAAHYDGETTPEERAEVERHLATCPECARDLASMKGLSAALKPLARAAAPMSIAEGVLREIAPVRSASFPWVRWGSSAAAALLLAVGTFYILDRKKPASEQVAMASERKANTHQPERLHREQDAEARFPMTKKAAAEPAPDPTPVPPAAPPAEEPSAKGRLDEGRGEEMEKKDKGKDAPAAEQKPGMAAKAPAAPVVPVVRVKAADVVAARAEVESFLAERELKFVPGAPLLGRSAYVHDNYLQLDLTAEEAALLERKLGALKDTELAKTTLDEERKRVAEQLAKLKPKGDALAAPKPADDDATKDRVELEGKVERSRGAAGGLTPDAKKMARSVRVIYVFEAVPAKR